MIDAETIKAMKSSLSLENCRPKYPEKFYGECSTPYGIVIVSGKDGVLGSPEAIAWLEKELSV
jgi:hypothetical protein